MYGGILGDIIGSVFERAENVSQDFRLLCKDSCFSGASVCTVALAEAIMENIEPVTALPKWKKRYSEHLAPEGECSWMGREEWLLAGASSIGFLAETPEEVLERAKSISESCPCVSSRLRRGTSAVGMAIYMGMTGVDFHRACGLTAAYFDYRNIAEPLDEVGSLYKSFPSFKNAVSAALASVFAAKSWEGSVRNAIHITGNSSIACAAGAIAEAFFGMPSEILEKGRRMLPEDMRAVIDRMYAHRPLQRQKLDWHSPDKFRAIADQFMEDEDE